MTQLYVSVDASSKDSLKSVDRPLFKGVVVILIIIIIIVVVLRLLGEVLAVAAGDEAKTTTDGVPPDSGQGLQQQHGRGPHRIR